MLKYVVVYERTPNNYGAYAPDVPGCAATALTWLKAKRLFAEALEVYLESCVEKGDPIPEPRMSITDAMADYVDVLSDGVDDGYSDYGDDVDVVEVTFGWVEVNVPDYATAGNPAATSRVAEES